MNKVFWKNFREDFFGMLSVLVAAVIIMGGTARAVFYQDVKAGIGTFVFMIFCVSVLAWIRNR